MVIYPEAIYAKGKGGAKTTASAIKPASSASAKPIILTKAGKISLRNLTQQQKDFLKSLPKTGGTYEFKVNGTPIKYVGQTNNFQRRFKEHFRDGKLTGENTSTFKVKTQDKPVPNIKTQSPQAKKELQDITNTYNEARRSIHETTEIHINKLNAEKTNQKMPNVITPKLK